MDERLQQVLDLAEMGFRVHPLIPGGKSPVVQGWPLLATTDPEMITKWFRVDKKRNWGIACGRGLIVIDIDVKKGDGMAEWEKFVGKRKLPTTVMAKSPSGGLHIYFLYPEELVIGNTAGSIAKFVDTRADGGFVASVPTVTERGKYQWVKGHSPYDVQIADMPKWLLKAVQEATVQQEWVPMGGNLENGNRNNTIYHYSLNLAKNGADLDFVLGAVEYWLNKQNVTDMANEEIIATVNSAFKHAKKKEQENCSMKEYLLSDAGNGDRFFDAYKDKAIYVPELKRWYLWNDKYWEADLSGQVNLLAEDMFKELIKDALEIKDDEKRRRVISHAIASTNQSRLKNAAENAAPKMMMSVEKLDTQRFKVNVNNGTLNLETQSLEPFNSEDYMTKTLNIDYDESAECPNFLNWLVWAFAGDQDLVRYIQYAIGRSLFGNPAKEAFFIYGPKDTGKTTLIHVIEELAGTYSRKFKIELLLHNGKTRDANDASPELAKLFGARFAVSSEMPPTSRLNESLFKDITGRDTISTRQLHQESFTFRPQFTLWLVGNDRPKIRAEDEAAFSRMRVIPFKVKVENEKKNPNLVQELFIPELSGILKWAFEGAIEAHHEFHNNVPIPAAVIAEVEAYRKEVDPISQFLDDGPLNKNPGSKANTKEVYQMFSSYMIATFGVRFNPVSSIAFTRQAAKLLECDTSRAHGQSFFIGYEINKEYRSNSMVESDW